MDSIFHRTSIRKFSDHKVESEKVIEVLKAAMAAPSAGNQQPWEFYVVNSNEVLKKLSKTSPYAGCTAKAPMAFVACYRKDCILPDYALIDLSAAVENMLLKIDALELGAVWLGIAPLQDRMDAVKDILKMPENLEAFAIIPCGYPLEKKRQQDRFETSRVHYIN